MSVCEWERERDKNENKLKQMENGREWMCEKWRNEDKKNDWYDSDETNGKEDEMNEIIWNDWIEMKRSDCIEYIYSYTCCRRSYGMSVKRYWMALAAVRTVDGHYSGFNVKAR